ncbi:hypothetical protein OEA41_010623 [Lepraria neglecta]|uniref:Heterokaryon incompatibility domain-containing protein n=1 Tax=Lepraria neglecta TaxID=209136 RepID=A0AAD9YY74_9LECA|nr:hypothetical protein OEA41_010623 [Lepraria neglecta]
MSTNAIGSSSTIYAEAQSVSVWLGQSGDGSTEGGQAIDFLVGLDQEIREEEQKQLHLQAQNEGGLSCLTNVFEYMEYAIDEYTWPALAAFFTRTYWRRIWIIQELAMGLEWLTFSCNGHEVSLSTLMRTAEFFSNRSETFVYKFLGEDGEGRNWQKVQAMSSAINLITRLKDLHEDIERFEMAETIQGLGETHQTRPSLSSLFDKLSLIRNADATEDHDKVYGILGLLHPTLWRRIDPDCLLPVEDIYVNFMQNLLKDTLYLGFVCYGSQVSSLLPSWVIDWRKPSDRSFLFMEQSEKEHSRLQLSVEAANTSISEQTDTSMGLNNLRCDIDIHFSENFRLLHCKGVQLTRIDGCFCSISPDNLKTDLCPESVDTPTHLPLPPIENMIQFLVESTEKLTQPTCTNSVYPDLKTLKSSLECSILWSKSSTSYDDIGIFDIPLYNDLRPGKKILDQLRTNNWNLVKHTIYYKRFTAFRRINAIFNFCGTKFQDLFSTLLHVDIPHRRVTRESRDLIAVLVKESRRTRDIIFVLQR